MKLMFETFIGVIGGSGLYGIPELEHQEWKTVDTPWGAPSDQLLFGSIRGIKVVFLPRHGRGHRLSPSTINYRANIDALKRIGVTDIVSLSACGSFKEDIVPGTFVLVDQFIDRTTARARSFFGDGFVAHVSMARPVADRLVSALDAAMDQSDIPRVYGGTYLCIEGPQFSTYAESTLYRDWGCDVIGMTNMPEAKLAREAEIPYAAIAMVTDFDCWHPDHNDVQMEDILRVMKKNTIQAQELIVEFVTKFPRERNLCASGADRALDGSIVTARESWDPQLMKRLDAVAGRVIES